MFFMSITSFPADFLMLPRPLIYLGATLLLLRVWRAVWRVLTSHTLSQISVWICWLSLLLRAGRNKILSPFICRSYHLFFMFFLWPGSQAFRPSHISLPLQSPVFHFISLFLFLPSSFSPECRCIPPLPLPFTPSQDKQPLYWGMSAICSKRLLDGVQTWVSEGRKAYKFSTFSQSLPLFFIFLGRRYPPFFFLQALSRLHPSLKTDTWAPKHPTINALFNVPPFPTTLTRKSSNSLLVRTFHHPCLINTQRENQTVLVPLPASSSTRERRSNTQRTFDDSVTKHSQIGVCLSLRCLEKLYQSGDLKWTFLSRQGFM